jgi:hypothetical protein
MNYDWSTPILVQDTELFLDSLGTALLAIGGFIAIVYVIGASSEALRSFTGKSLGEWAGSLIITGILLLVGYGFILLIGYGMSEDLVAYIILGIVALGFVGLFLWGLWHVEPGSVSDYDPMAGKKKHYDRDGTLTGYSDEE